jgi:RNAse (barnase) inhibitor barstar
MLIAAFGGLEEILLTIQTTALETFLPFLVIAAIGLAVEDLIVFLKGGDSALGAFLDTLFGAGSAEIVLKGIRDTFNTISDWFTENGPAISAFWDTFKTLAGESLQGIGLFIVDLIGWLGDLGEYIWATGEAIVDAFTQADQFVANLFEALWDLITGDVDGVAQHFRDALGSLAEFFGGLFDIPAQKVHDVIDGVLDKVKTAATAAGRFLTGDFSGAATAAAQVFSGSTAAPQATAAGLPAAGGGKTTSIADQRVLNVNVNSATAANAAATGREVGAAVTHTQAEDRSAILAAVQ